MRVQNQTADPVEYEQNGAPPAEEGGEIGANGTLQPGQWEEFQPGGKAPFKVTFAAPPGGAKDKVAEVGAIMAADATVVLTAFPVVV